MIPFGGYASFYDALYGDKDYEGECDFVEQVIASHATGPVRRLLDLGCGTGGHLLPLARRGYEVAGVDRSGEMLARARQKGTDAALPLSLHEADLRSLELGERFDAVLSMFAVLSYQTENADVRAAFDSAARHLGEGGLFLFDVWFGPAVLCDPPVDRYKDVTEGEERVVRFAHPEMALLRQVVTVHYHIMRLRGGQLLEELQEAHEMRYFFPQELAALLEGSGFETLALFPFGRPAEEATTASWTVSVVARKQKRGQGG